MKKGTFYGLIILVLLTISCKGEKQSNQEQKKEELNQPNQELIEKDFFTFSINAVFKKNDSIYFYYLTPEVDKITIKNSLQKNVEGSVEPQTISFNLPEEVLPTRIFFRYGDNKEQKIDVKNVKLSYGKNIINIPDSLFIQYFNPNKSAIFSKEDYSLKVNTNNNQNPMFFSRIVLENKIDLTFL